MDKMYDLVRQWRELNQNKSSYAFADEPFDKENFVQLVKESMQEILKYRKMALNFDDHVKELKKITWDYNMLLVEIAIYSAETMADESEEYIFTASQVITRLLLENVTYRCRVTPLDNTGVLCGSFEECGLYCPSEEDLNSEFWSQSFKYDPNEGDMSLFIELAKRSIG